MTLDALNDILAEAARKSGSYIPSNPVGVNDLLSGEVSFNVASPDIRYFAECALGVEMTYKPINNTTWRVTVDVSDIENPATESIYKDGDGNTLVSVSKDGKDYMVSKDGMATQVTDDDEYVANLNKTAGTTYRKEAESLARAIKDANICMNGKCTVRSTAAESHSRKFKAVVECDDEDLLRKAATCMPIDYLCDSGETYGNGYDDETEEFVYEFPIDEPYCVTDFYTFLNALVDLVCSSGPEPQEPDWVSSIETSEPNYELLDTYSDMDSDCDIDALREDELGGLAKALVPQGPFAVESVLHGRCKDSRAIAEAVCAKKRKHTK